MRTTAARALVGFPRWLYGFIVGDDPLVAVAVVAALTLTAVLAGVTGAAWVVLPVVVVAVLGDSLRRAGGRRAAPPR